MEMAPDPTPIKPWSRATNVEKKGKSQNQKTRKLKAYEDYTILYFLLSIVTEANLQGNDRPNAATDQRI